MIHQPTTLKSVNTITVSQSLAEPCSIELETKIKEVRALESFCPRRFPYLVLGNVRHVYWNVYNGTLEGIPLQRPESKESLGT